jgi:hypothetical protein
MAGYVLLGIVIGLPVGTTLGILIMALLAMAKHGDMAGVSVES